MRCCQLTAKGGKSAGTSGKDGRKLGLGALDSILHDVKLSSGKGAAEEAADGQVRAEGSEVAKLVLETHGQGNELLRGKAADRDNRANGDETRDVGEVTDSRKGQVVARKALD